MAAKVQVTRAEAQALAGVLASPVYEVMPVGSSDEAVAALPAGARVSVTASPSRGLEPTVAMAEALAAAGFAVAPHLSARLVRDENHLGEVLERAAAAGITRAVVIGGDANVPGDFPDAVMLLEAMAAIGHPFTSIGVAGYPEGHAFIPDDALAAALEAKQLHATHVITQLGFDPGAIAAWIVRARAAGITLPVHVGTAGVAPLLKLARIATRIGIGDSIRFVTRQHGLLGALARPGGYAPDEFLTGLAPVLLDPSARIEALHVYTFNQVASFEAWRREMLDELAPKE